MNIHKQNVNCGVTWPNGRSRGILLIKASLPRPVSLIIVDRPRTIASATWLPWNEFVLPASR